jgi:hypothetical protein
MLRARDYSGLEGLADYFRRTEARTSAGAWKLSIFYAAVNDLTTIDRDDESAWIAMSDTMRRWVDEYPSSPTAYIADAIAWKQHAWQIRPRSIVLKAAMASEDQFLATLITDRDFLDRNKSIASQDPHFYAVRAELGSALLEKPERMMALLDEGMARAPDYYPIYFAGMDYFAPTDDTGNADAARRMEAFANRAIERTQGREGLAVYARLYWHIYGSVLGKDLFRSSMVSWPKMRQGILDVLRQYPDPWNVSNFAYLACLQGDREMTRQLVVSAGREPVLDVWKPLDLYKRCRDWSAEQADTTAVSDAKGSSDGLPHG